MSPWPIQTFQSSAQRFSVFLLGDLKACDITMGDEELMELMGRVKNGQLSVKECLDIVSYINMKSFYYSHNRPLIKLSIAVSICSSGNLHKFCIVFHKSYCFYSAPLQQTHSSVIGMTIPEILYQPYYQLYSKQK